MVICRLDSFEIGCELATTIAFNFYFFDSPLDSLFSEVSSCLDLADPRSLIFGTGRVSFRSTAVRIISILY